MRPRLLPALLLTLAATAQASAAFGQQLVFLAFGDSITEGYGDTSSPGGGYPTRLQRWLRQQGYDCFVENYGVGGETTSSGLSRIDSVLDGGGDYLLLMEGTNDISQRVGVESIRFNLDEMAHRAEARNIIVVHASVIPRVPTAPADASNAATSALALAIRTMGLASHRAVADQFTLFEGLPDVFENYYYYDPDFVDIVGHPNSDGYIEIAGLFLETLLPLLETPDLRIIPPPTPLNAGALAAFGVAGHSVEDFVRVDWDFGDGGVGITSPPGDLTAFYVYLHPGTYTATARGLTSEGGFAQDSVEVVVTGTEPEWQTRSTLLPLVARTQDGLIVTDLVLANSGILFAIAEVTFLPEIHYDEAPPARRFLFPIQSEETIAELLSSALGLGSGRGALKVTFYAYPEGSLASLSVRATVHATTDPDGSQGATVTGIPSAAWSAAAKSISGIPQSTSSSATLAVTNLDETSGTVSFRVFDGVGAEIGSGVMAIGPHESRLRSIADLFRNLTFRPTPFTAVFSAAGIRFSAATLVTNQVNGDVSVLAGTTAP